MVATCMLGWISCLDWKRQLVPGCWWKGAVVNRRIFPSSWPFPGQVLANL